MSQCFSVDTIHEQFERYAEQPFLLEVTTARRFTYTDFYRLACRAAGFLRAHGMQQRDRVALLLPNSAEFAALYFGCLFLGVVAVPINLHLHRREVAFILRHSGVRLVVCSPTTRGLFEEPVSASSVPILGVTLGHEQERTDEAADCFAGETPAPFDWSDQQPLTGVAADDLFTIMFTSGTTSTPKGVAHRIGGLFANAAMFNEALAFGPANRFLHLMPMAYMAGLLNTLLCPFMAGASVVLASPFDSRTLVRFWEPVRQYGANTFWLTPTMVTALLQVDRDQDGMAYCRKHVQTVCVGTAPLPQQTRQDFEHKYGVELFESYGMSELVFVSSQSHRRARLAGSVGGLLPGVEVRIVDDRGEPQSPGQEGELWVRIPTIMAGYLNPETLQPDPVDPADWFATGDLGRLDCAGNLFITGRKKDLIIRGGMNISPRAIEEVLLEHQAVVQAAVIGLPHFLYGEEVVAVLRLKPGWVLEAVRPELEAHCRTNLSTAVLPTRYVALAELPVSTTGKIHKARLRQMLASQAPIQRR